MAGADADDTVVLCLSRKDARFLVQLLHHASGCFRDGASEPAHTTVARLFRAASAACGDEREGCLLCQPIPPQHRQLTPGPFLPSGSLGLDWRHGLEEEERCAATLVGRQLYVTLLGPGWAESSESPPASPRTISGGGSAGDTSGGSTGSSSPTPPASPATEDKHGHTSRRRHRKRGEAGLQEVCACAALGASTHDPH